jgi:hypothetical protein
MYRNLVSPYKHSLPKVARLINANPNIRIKIVLGCDSICQGCIHNKKSHCDDLITNRKDFTSKEKLNNFIDRKIAKKCSIKIGSVYSAAQLCQKGHLYLDNIEFIYYGNKTADIKKRKENVIKGLSYYSQKHNLTK